MKPLHKSVSDAYPGPRHTALIAMDFYLHGLYIGLQLCIREGRWPDQYRERY
jgi:hypothetical protein